MATGENQAEALVGDILILIFRLLPRGSQLARQLRLELLSEETLTT